MSPVVLAAAAAALALACAVERHLRLGRARARARALELQAVETRNERDAAIKRVEARALEEARYATAPLLRTVFEHADNLDRALQAQPQEDLQLLRDALMKSLSRHAVVRIQPASAEAFDPKVHEAVGLMPDPALPEGTVARCERAGYRLHERLLRPAQVLVASAEEAS